jgi:hypothetical protein
VNFYDFGNITTVAIKNLSGYGIGQQQKPQKYRESYDILPMLPNYLIKRKNK